MNNKGFFMAELIVVSSVVLVVLVSMFASFNKIYSVYENIINYNDVVSLYRLGYYRDVLINNDLLNSAINNSNVNVVQIYNSIGGTVGDLFGLPAGEVDNLNDFADLVFLVNNNNNKIDVSKFEGKGLHTSFFDYIDYFNGNAKYQDFDYVMLMERCNKNNDGTVIHDGCKYAYLDVSVNCE